MCKDSEPPSGLKRRSVVPDGFGGTREGSFFKSPAWVNESKPAGATDQSTFLAQQPAWGTLLSGKFLFFSPNLIWLLAALLVYFIFPYNIPAAKTLEWDWILYRFKVNFGVTFGYVGFWHVVLYALNWSSRPFKGDRTYRWGKTLHNVWYNILAVVQHTAWEVLMLHCYATGRMPYLSNEEAFASWKGALQFGATFFLVPLYREFHFYWAHRFLHIKFLYKYCHSLHHRNTDTEPFAGLCMHPIEHLFYFSCVGPSLLLFATPFAFSWNFWHLMLAPAASHSGWEDHWQSDQFHYLHHRFFECNYGTPTFPMDVIFGTFREKLDVKSETYKGQHVQSKSNNLLAAANNDAKSTLMGIPKMDELVYNVTTCVAMPFLVLAAHMKWYGVESWSLNLPFMTITNSQLIGAIMSTGSLVISGILLMLTTPKALQNVRRTFFYPFHQEALFGVFGFSVLVAWLVTVLPVYALVQMFLGEPGDSLYHTLGLLLQWLEL